MPPAGGLAHVLLMIHCLFFIISDNIDLFWSYSEIYFIVPSGYLCSLACGSPLNREYSLLHFSPKTLDTCVTVHLLTTATYYTTLNLICQYWKDCLRAIHLKASTLKGLPPTTTKTVQDLPEKHDKVLRGLTWLFNAPNLTPCPTSETWCYGPQVYLT